jgi:hypothetical protein
MVAVRCRGTGPETTSVALPRLVDGPAWARPASPAAILVGSLRHRVTGDPRPLAAETGPEAHRRETTP